MTRDDQNAKSFYMVVIGDSIAWGSGLNNGEKYCYIVKQWLEERLQKNVTMENHAQTGARLIGHSTKKPCDQNCARWYPSVEDQIDEIPDGNCVELILLSGGINDVGVLKIIDANTNAAEIAGRSGLIRTWMLDVLKRSLLKFPKAKIIVTNYYPIITEETIKTASFSMQYYLIYNLFFSGRKISLKSIISGNYLVDLPYDYQSNLIKNSNTFNKISTDCLSSAVDIANKFSIEVLKEKEGRVAFASIHFPSDKCYGTTSSWLWKLLTFNIYNKKFLIDDNLLFYRLKKCLLCHDRNIYDVVNAIGHPNIDGAKTYAKSIESTIECKWINKWKDH